MGKHLKNNGEYFDDYYRDGEREVELSDSVPVKTSARRSRTQWVARDAEPGEQFTLDDILAEKDLYGNDPDEAAAWGGFSEEELLPEEDIPPMPTAVPSRHRTAQADAPVRPARPVYEEEHPAAPVKRPVESDTQRPARRPERSRGSSRPARAEYDETRPVRKAESAARPTRPEYDEARPVRKGAERTRTDYEGDESRPVRRRTDTAYAVRGTEETRAPARKARPYPEEDYDAPRTKKRGYEDEYPPRRKSPPEDDGYYESPRSKKKSFKKRLRVYVIILLVIFVAALAVMWYFLGKFQAKKDAENEARALQEQKAAADAAEAKALHRAPQLAFEEWLAGTTPDSWTELWYSSNPEDSNGQDSVRAYMEEAFAEAKPYKALDFTEEKPVYVLKNDAEALVHVTLGGSGLDWSVDTVDWEIRGDKSASARVAVGSTVYCNGQQLGEEYAGEVSSTFGYAPLADQLINPVSWTTYTVSGMLVEPVLSVTPPEGCSVTETESGDFLLCLVADEASEGYRKKAVDFVRAYLYYYLSGGTNVYGNLAGAKAYLYPGSQGAQELQETVDGVYWNSTHTQIDTSNATAGDVVIWADNCYSVDVTYAASGMVGGQLDEYAATMRVYFTQVDGAFVMTHFETL